MTDMPARVRGPRPSDQAYISATWVNSMSLAREYKGQKRSQARAFLAPLVDRLLDRGDVAAIVAHASDDPERILGWLVYSPIPRAPVLHYVYVRGECRTHGVGRSLVDAANLAAAPRLVYTLLGPAAAWLLKKRSDAVHLSIERFLS